MTFQNKLNFFFLFVILLLTFSCQSQSTNKKSDTIKPDSERLKNTQSEFSLVREFQSKEEFSKNRKLVRNINISTDKRRVSYIYDEAEKQIQLREPFEENINVINISPKGEIFFAYSDGEIQSKNIFLYSLQGNLIRKLELNTYPSIKYSSNGKYISIANLFGNSFSFYNAKGNKIVAYTNYQNLIKTNQSPLHLVDLAPDKESFLLYSDKFYLYSNESEKLLWKKNFPFVLNSLFLQNAIVLVCKNPNNRLRTLKLISRKDGRLISEIKDISKVSINEKKNSLF